MAVGPPAAPTRKVSPFAHHRSSVSGQIRRSRVGPDFPKTLRTDLCCPESLLAQASAKCAISPADSVQFYSAANSCVQYARVVRRLVLTNLRLFLEHTDRRRSLIQQQFVRRRQADETGTNNRD